MLKNIDLTPLHIEDSAFKPWTTLSIIKTNCLEAFLLHFDHFCAQIKS